MSKILFSFLIFLFAFQADAQQVAVSSELAIRNDDDFHMVGRIGENILLFKDKGDGFKIFAYDGDLIEKWDKIVDFESRRSKIHKIIPAEDHFTVIYSFFKKGVVNLRAMQFNSEGDTLSSGTIRSYIPRATNYLDIVVSENKNIIFAYDADINSKMYTSAYNISSHELLWYWDMTPFEFDFDRDFVQALINDQGDAYVILERDNKKAKRNTSRFEVMTYSNENQKESRYDLSLKGKLWFDVKFEFDNLNDHLLAAGLYSNKRYGETNGFFYLKVNPANPTEYLIKFSEFDAQFITTILGKESKKEAGFGEVSVQELVLRRDGGILMIAERNKRYTRRATSYNSFYNPDYAVGYQVDYHFNDILLVSANPDGAIHWKELLRKRQFSQDDRARYSSYFLMKTPNSLRFIYNDEIKFDTNVNEYIVLANGNHKRKSIFTTNKEDLSLLLRTGIQISAHEMLVASERRGDFKLVKVTY